MSTSSDQRWSTRWPVLVARIRMSLMVLSVLLLVVGREIGIPFIPRVVLFVVALAVVYRLGTVRRPPITVTAPVVGRWQAINSPADKVPSHGLHSYGQTYAVDLLHTPTDRERPAFGWSPLVRPPRDFPAFGEPVVAPFRRHRGAGQRRAA